MGIAACTFILALKNVFIGFYDIPVETKELASRIITVFAFITIGTSTNMTLIMGALEAPAIQKFCMRTEVICLLGLGYSFGACDGVYCKSACLIVFFFMKIDEIVKAILCLIRMKGDKWLNSLTREGAANKKGFEL